MLDTSKLRILESTFKDITRFLTVNYSKSQFHAAILCREIFQKQNPDVSKIPELITSGSLLSRLTNDIHLNPGIVSNTVTDGEVYKFITSLSDGCEIESVLVPMKDYVTLCISSQVGCALGCIFCETGRKGFLRNLSVEEIVGQLYNAKLILKKGYIKNIVFMGMGEPLENTDNVIQAVKVFSDQRCFNIPRKNMTLSTVGIPHKLIRFGESLCPMPNLAISLNAANDHTRSRIMPVSRTYDLQSLKSALLSLPLRRKKIILFGYVLMKDLNDSYADAQQLIQFLKPFNARVNLIPYNKNTCEGILCPEENKILQFRDWLVAGGLFVRKRTARGDNLAAGCGQLGKWTAT